MTQQHQLPLQTSDATTQVFNFNGDYDFRTLTLGGQFLFLAQDACRVLDLVNTTDALSRLDADEKMTLASTEGHSGKRGGAQFHTYVTESGLYSLVLGSRKPEAKAFKKWITSVVIPSLRQHGGYVMGQEKVATGEVTQAEYLARAFVMAQSVIADADAKIAALETTVVDQDFVIVRQGNLLLEQAPKVAAHDDFIRQPGECGLRETANDIGVPQGKFMALLRAKGLILQSTKHAEASAKALNLGIFLARNVPTASGNHRRQTVVTNLGRDYLRTLVLTKKRALQRARHFARNPQSAAL